MKLLRYLFAVFVFFPFLFIASILITPFNAKEMNLAYWPWDKRFWRYG